MTARLLLLVTLPVLTLGCATSPENPSFPLSVDQARKTMDEMELDPKPLDRPVVIVGGYLDVGIGAALVKDALTPVTEDERIETVCLFGCGSFDECRKSIVAAVDRAFPCPDPDRTTEVDVIGISMGGLAARYAAAPLPRHGRRLRIGRLFTVSSPHQGAVAADLPTFHPLALQMRHGSPLLKAVAGFKPDYPIYPYVRLGDAWVGVANAAPAGRVAWWLPNRWFEDSHIGAATDPRILADIARRLRREPPFTREPPAPLPG